MRRNPTPITQLGMAYSRRGEIPFGIHLQDRAFHMVMFGQTGTGKSTMLFNMARQDASQGIGFCLIDPHGDLAGELAAELGEKATVWNVADPASPYGYNPLTRTSQALRPLVASGLIETLHRQWGDASWGPRMEHLLRHAILALLDQPTTDMRDIMRLFLDRSFRREVLARVHDSQVRQFWAEEYPAMNYKSAMDGVAPIANKLGAFLSNPVVRRALCEPEQPLRFRRIMDEGGHLIINLAKGRLGTDIANVVGGLIVSAVTHAAFSRQDTNHRPAFITYIDEFHSFTTDALADTLSEARKYGLALTLVAQHIFQASAEQFAGIMGNVGSMVVFRVGATDAPLLSKQLGTIAPEDLINLPNYHTFMRLMIDGERSKAFSARTLNPRGP